MASPPIARVFGTALAVLLVSHAQWVRGDEPAALTWPVLVTDSQPLYPQSELEGRAPSPVAVPLRLLVGADGAVEDAEVEGWVLPAFAESALAAARQLRFAPARRDNQPVQARIRHGYLFVAPPARLMLRAVDATTRAWVSARLTVRKDGEVLLLDASSQTAESPRGGRFVVLASAPGYASNRAELEVRHGETVELTLPLLAHVPLHPELTPAEHTGPLSSPAQTIEVTVWGERPAPTVRTLSRGEVRELPGAFGDPFRAIESLPGVTPIVSGLPFFFVRGAPPGNLGYFLDDVRVPYLFHLMLGPSVVHPGLVDQVDLYAGAYPARWGRFAGGVVSAVTRAPATRPRGEANLRVFDAGALVESPFAEGRATALVGARYSYTAGILSLVSPEIDLDYRDYQARLTYDLSQTERLSFMGFGAYDLLTTREQGFEKVLFGAEFYRATLGYTREDALGRLRVQLTPAYDRTLIDEGGSGELRALGLRIDAARRLHDHIILRGGLDGSVDENRHLPSNYADPDDPGQGTLAALFPSRTDRVLGLYVESVLDVDPSLEVTPGLRLDLYQIDANTALAIEPRVSTRYQLSPRVSMVHAFGLAHQPPAFVVPMPGLNRGDMSGGLQWSAQLNSTVEFGLTANTQMTTTGFYNAFFDLTDTIGTASRDSDDEEMLTRRSRGLAMGLELMLKRKLTDHLGGYLAYTWSRSTRSIGREHFYATFDRTHVMNGALAYDLGRAWRAGTRLVFMTGIPFANLAPSPVSGTLRNLDTERTDAFFRLDLRLEKRWLTSGNSHLSFVAELMNATLSREMIGNEEIGPVTIPSLGLEGGF